MSDSIKKLLSIMNETTTSGAVAPVAGGMGKSMLKRPTDTIFAAESVPEDADTGLEAAPKVDSPSNFGLWKNSAVIGKEQYGKHGRKKSKVDKTQIYPQLKESQFKQVHQAGLDALNRNRQSDERNAGLNEPDESPYSFQNKLKDFGTWYFTYQDGSVVVKNGKPVLASTPQGASDIIAIAKKHGIVIKKNDGAPPELSESGYEAPKDMDDWSEDDWAKWDEKVKRVGKKAKEQDGEPVNEISQGARDRYVARASSDYSDANFAARASKSHPGLEDYSKEKEQRAKKRAAGLNMALSDKRLGRSEVKENRVDSSVSQAIIDRISDQYRGLLKYGPDKVMAAINVVSGWHKGDAVDPDAVSEWVNQVARYLRTGAGEGLGESQDKNKIAPSTPRNFVAKNAKTAGAGVHKDMKRLAKRGDVKHKSRQYELNEYSEWDGTGDADLAAATAASGYEAGFADIEDKTSLAEAEITEEMIADRLKNELALFKKGSKSKDKSIGKKPADKEVQQKTPTKAKK